MTVCEQAKRHFLLSLFFRGEGQGEGQPHDDALLHSIKPKKESGDGIAR
jgi:hypothetical protein